MAKKKPARGGLLGWHWHLKLTRLPETIPRKGIQFGVED